MQAPEPNDGLSAAETERLREALLRFSQEYLHAPGREALDRIQFLHGLLGEAACRKLGIYPLPGDFLLSVIIPVYNEAATIEKIVDRVRATGLPLEMILVDDASTDGTRDVLHRLEGQEDLRILFHRENQGKGAAVRTGLLQAGGDVLVIQDADMEYDPQDFHFLLQPILEGQADVVYGSRFASIDREVSPAWHRFGNKFITFLANIRTGLSFTDVETCYKMFRRESVEDILPTLRERRFGIEIELTCKLARKKGLRFFERPIRYYRRSYAEGKKIGWRDGVSALRCMLRY